MLEVGLASKMPSVKSCVGRLEEAAEVKVREVWSPSIFAGGAGGVGEVVVVCW